MEKGREVKPTIKDKVQQELNHSCKIKQKESTITILCSHPVIKLLAHTFQMLSYFQLTVKRTDENCYTFLLPNWLISIFISTNSSTQPLEATKLNIFPRVELIKIPIQQKQTQSNKFRKAVIRTTINETSPRNNIAWCSTNQILSL